MRILLWLAPSAVVAALAMAWAAWRGWVLGRQIDAHGWDEPESGATSAAAGPVEEGISVRPAPPRRVTTPPVTTEADPGDRDPGAADPDVATAGSRAEPGEQPADLPAAPTRRTA